MGPAAATSAGSRMGTALGASRPENPPGEYVDSVGTRRTTRARPGLPPMPAPGVHQRGARTVAPESAPASVTGTGRVASATP